MRYQVSSYYFGPNGTPALEGFPGHEWRTVAETSRKIDAIAAAAKQPIRTVVIDTKTYKTIYENGRPHGDRAHWRRMLSAQCPCPDCQF